MKLLHADSFTYRKCFMFMSIHFQWPLIHVLQAFPVPALMRTMQLSTCCSCFLSTAPECTPMWIWWSAGVQNIPNDISEQNHMTCQLNSSFTVHRTFPPEVWVCVPFDQMSRVMSSRLMYIMMSLFNPKHYLFHKVILEPELNQVFNLTRRWLLQS